MEQKEYIDRVAFKRKLIDEKAVYPACVARALDEMPVEDVAPVVHGEWKKRTTYPIGYDCSECNNSENYKSPFCRLCGAKMDGGKHG